MCFCSCELTVVWRLNVGPLTGRDSDLQIYAVSPVPENQDVLQRDGVPNNIKSFYKVNHIWRFRYDRPFHKGTKDKENEFKVL